ncbi:Polysaccharide biosynthesis protein [Shewanella piezotolerans WP3]|uniref:Polysaccharide biosynthesis protein n=1 Tax=Shewanella piezotolerans (strain WP3 / JCM 13877) TaxID=225849 RepID=B8CL23_SHEPW|nr:polysaccharide biosynthesis protein [Shewanella piezotolerans]ACJ28349.1 Polysaccharide biosynthesis protein [Shewanella piezotolerans WP3]
MSGFYILCEVPILSKIFKYGVSEGLAKLIPFATIFVFAHQFSSELVGTLTLLIVTVEILSIIVINNTAAVTRIDFFKFETDVLKKQLNTQLSNSLTSSLLLLIIIVPILIYEEVSAYYYILLFVPCLRTYTTTSLALLQCRKETNQYLKAQVIFSITYLIVFAMLYKQGILSWIVALCVGLTLQAIYLKATNTFVSFSKIVIVPKKDSLNVALKGIAFMPQAIGWWLRSGAERYLIAFYLGVATLGQYALSVQISAIAVLFVTAINLAIVPEVNRHLSSGSSKELLKINKIYRFTFILLFIAVLLLWFSGYSYLSAYYAEYAISKEILWIACLSTLFQSCSMVLMNELYFRGKAILVAKYVLICFIIQAGLQFLVLNVFAELYIVLLVNVIFSVVLLLLVVSKIVLFRKIHKVI